MPIWLYRNKIREIDIPQIESALSTTYLGIISDLSIWHQKLIILPSRWHLSTALFLLLLQLDLFAFFGILIVVVS